MQAAFFTAQAVTFLRKLVIACQERRKGPDVDNSTFPQAVLRLCYKADQPSNRPTAYVRPCR